MDESVWSFNCLVFGHLDSMNRSDGNPRTLLERIDRCYSLMIYSKAVQRYLRELIFKTATRLSKHNSQGIASRHSIRSDKDGTVKKINYQVGELVQGGVTLAEVE